jgi:zinc transport system substrate-binding protein
MPLVILVILSFVFGCGTKNSEKAVGEKITVVVGIPPQKFLVEQIGGDNVIVTTLVSPGQSSHTFEPTPRQTAKLAQAQLFFRTGEPFEEGLVSKIASSFPNVTVVDLRRGISLRDDSHGHNGGESHGDPHIYLTPSLLKVQAQTVTDCLIGVIPDKQSEIRFNYGRFIARLDSLDREVRTLLAPFAGDTIIVYHSAFGYFADEYGIVQVAVEKEGKEPGAKDLGELIDVSRRLRVSAIFVQPQYAAKSAETLAAAIGAKVQNLDPLKEDVIENLREIAVAFRDELAGRRSSER